MRICLFTPNFLPGVGGTEYVTDALARQFHAMGQHVVVLAVGDPVPLDLPYPVEWAPRPLFPRLFPERAGTHLKKLHEREHFDVFCCNYAHPTGYAAVRLTERTGVPTVIVSHGGDLYRSSRDRQRPHLWKRTLYAYNHAQGLIAISPYIEDLIREVNPNPRHMERIPNGIDLAEYAKPAERPADFTDTRPFALCLGNLGPMKGFADAIAAYAQTRGRLRDMALVIVGNGPLEDILRAQVRGLGLETDVLFMGRRTGGDKRWFLQNCLYGLMPSIEEGHPIVGLELLASGKPVICSTNAAFDGMYEEGVNALRVPAQQPDLLAQAMMKMAGSDLGAMANASRGREGDYDWSSISRRYLGFLERVVSTHQRGRARS
ncbi:MAG: glycosyltransferase family 4 protein [Planctomycetes bacterium]|nr:glycosyltransferase family 4 protein [Planctomycetota bacterium]